MRLTRCTFTFGNTVYYNTWAHRFYDRTCALIARHLTHRCPMCRMGHGGHKFSCYYKY